MGSTRHSALLSLAATKSGTSALHPSSAVQGEWSSPEERTVSNDRIWSFLGGGCQARRRTGAPVR